MNSNNNSDNNITQMRHNDYVGSDANIGRIPGADQATTGHHYVAVFPKEGEQKRHADGVARPEEHVPPPTGRDLPPRGINQPVSATDQGLDRVSQSRNREPAPGHRFEQNAPQPLPPAPDSRTVVDRDPFATRTTASDTMTGATSQDVYESTGKPGSGMSSAEMHHDGKPHRKRQGGGQDQFGTADELRRQDETDAWLSGEARGSSRLMEANAS